MDKGGAKQRSECPGEGAGKGAAQEVAEGHRERIGGDRTIMKDWKVKGLVKGLAKGAAEGPGKGLGKSVAKGLPQGPATGPAKGPG